MLIQQFLVYQGIFGFLINDCCCFLIGYKYKMEIYNYWVLEKLNIEFKDFSLLGSFEVSKVNCYKIREF